MVFNNITNGSISSHLPLLLLFNFMETLVVLIMVDDGLRFMVCDEKEPRRISFSFVVSNSNGSRWFTMMEGTVAMNGSRLDGNNIGLYLNAGVLPNWFELTSQGLLSLSHMKRLELRDGAEVKDKERRDLAVERELSPKLLVLTPKPNTQQDRAPVSTSSIIHYSAKITSISP